MDIDDLYQLSRQYLENKQSGYERYFIRTTPLKHKLSILVGQRGVGKTTLIVQYLLQYAQGQALSRDILYVPADHFIVGNRSLYEIAESFQLLGGKWIAFDEIHKYPGWSKELKSIRDTFPKLQIIASGSSALEIHKGSHDLTRRAAVYKIQGLSFREYLELKLSLNLPTHALPTVLQDHEKIAKNLLAVFEKQPKPLLAHFKEYLKTGYYPYFFETQDADTYWMTLEQNVHATIESDLTAIYLALTGNSIRKVKQLLTYIAQEVPFTLHFQKLKTLLDIGDERTLKTYLKYLEDGGLIRQLLKASTQMKRIESPEKIYLHNPNQLYAIAPAPHNIGTLRELFFLTMLSFKHTLTAPELGDFMVDHKLLFEIGGRSKKIDQVRDQTNAYLACDDIEIGLGQRIPLWLFGFLY